MPGIAGFWVRRRRVVSCLVGLLVEREREGWGGDTFLWCFQLVHSSFPLFCLGDGMEKTHLVIYRAKDFLGCYDQARHLPDCHFEIHLRELE